MNKNSTSSHIIHRIPYFLITPLVHNQLKTIENDLSEYNLEINY